MRDRIDLFGPASVVALFLFVLVMIPLSRHGMNPTWFHKFGAVYVDPVRRPEGAHVFQSVGYDGQFYYCAARDPFAKDGAANYMDGPPYRYTRIGLPWLARLLGGSDPMRISWMFLVINYFSIVLGTLAISLWFRKNGRSGWFGLMFGLSGGILISILHATTECLALALLAWGLLAVRRGASVLSAFLFSYSALTRETALYVLSSGMVLPWINKIKKQRVSRFVFLAPFVAFAGWQVYLGTQMYGNYFSNKQAGPRLLDFIHTLKITGFSTQAGMISNIILMIYVALVCLVFIGGLVIVFSKPKWAIFREQGFVISALLISSGLAFFYPHDVWSHAVNYVRVLSDVFFWGLIVQAIYPSRLLFTASLLNVLIGPPVIKILSAG